MTMMMILTLKMTIKTSLCLKNNMEDFNGRAERKSKSEN
jgi:hypothetical protein